MCSALGVLILWNIVTITPSVAVVCCLMRCLMRNVSMHTLKVN